MMHLYKGGRSLCAIWENTNLNSSEKLILLAFSSRLNFNGNFQEWRYIEKKELCRLTSLKLRQMTSLIHALVQKGYLQIEMRKSAAGSFIASSYKLSEKLFIEYGQSTESSTIPSAEIAPPPSAIIAPPSAIIAYHQVPSIAPSESIYSVNSTYAESDSAKHESQIGTPLASQAQPLGCLENVILEQKKPRKKKLKPDTKPERTKKEKPKNKKDEKSPGAKVWDYYATKFAEKYNVAPFRSAKGYSLSKQLASLAGVDGSHTIIDSYFLTKDSFILKTRHPIGYLVSNVDRFLVDSVNKNNLTSGNTNSKRYSAPKLSHDDTWERDWEIMTSGKFSTYEEYEKQLEELDKKKANAIVS